MRSAALRLTVGLLTAAALSLAPVGRTQADGIEQPMAASVAINDIVTVEGGLAIFTVTLSGASLLVTYSVDYQVLPFSATPGQDYTPVSGTLFWGPVDRDPKALPIPMLEDTLDEDAETLIVQLLNPQALPGGTLSISDPFGVGTINDDDPLPAISVSNATKAEGDTHFSFMDFNVTLNTPSGREVSVTWATANGTATAGPDYLAQVPTVLTFTPGQTVKQAPVRIFGDLAIEPDETLLVNLSAPVNATIADSQGTGTIVNDDVVGGTFFTVTTIGDDPVLRWLTGNQQTGYTLLIYNTATAAAGLINLPASEVGYTDAAASVGVVYCYVLAATGPSGLLGLSDLLCGMAGQGSGTVIPNLFKLSLGGTGTATMSWLAPAGGADSYLLQVIPLDGSPITNVPLGGGATTINQPVVAAGTCFQLVAFKGTGFGTTDVLCGVPGIGTLSAAQSWLQALMLPLTLWTAELP